MSMKPPGLSCLANSEMTGLRTLNLPQADFIQYTAAVVMFCYIHYYHLFAIDRQKGDGMESFPASNDVTSADLMIRRSQCLFHTSALLDVSVGSGSACSLRSNATGAQMPSRDNLAVLVISTTIL